MSEGKKCFPISSSRCQFPRVTSCLLQISIFILHSCRSYIAEIMYDQVSSPVRHYFTCLYLLICILFAAWINYYLILFSVNKYLKCFFCLLFSYIYECYYIAGIVMLYWNGKINLSPPAILIPVKRNNVEIHNYFPNTRKTKISYHFLKI